MTESIESACCLPRPVLAKLRLGSAGIWRSSRSIRSICATAHTPAGLWPAPIRPSAAKSPRTVSPARTTSRGRSLIPVPTTSSSTAAAARVGSRCSLRIFHSARRSEWNWPRSCFDRTIQPAQVESGPPLPATTSLCLTPRPSRSLFQSRRRFSISSPVASPSRLRTLALARSSPLAILHMSRERANLFSADASQTR